MSRPSYILLNNRPLYLCVFFLLAAADDDTELFEYRIDRLILDLHSIPSTKDTFMEMCVEINTKHLVKK